MESLFKIGNFKKAAGIFTLVFLSGCLNFKNSPFTDQLESNARNLNVVMMEKIEKLGIDEKFRVAFISDSHQNYADFQSVIDRLNAQGDIDFVILGGDFTNFSYGFEYDYALDVISKSVHPVLTIMGNHDALGLGKQLFKKAFGPWNYTMTLGNKKLIFWNNNTLEYHEEGIDFDWLQTEIENTPEGVETVVVQHVDVLNVDYFTEQQRAEMLALYSDNNVRAVLHGHLHKFVTYHLGDTLIHQTSRIESEKYSLIDFSKDTIAIQICEGEVCQLIN